jgi:hypothetical protein
VAPDRKRLYAWLTSTDVVDASGAVTSWVNPHHPGFPYPEAAGIWLAWAAWRAKRGDDAPARAQVARIADHLALDLAEGGGVGKSDRTYLFDTCVALHGLAQSIATGTPVPAASRATRGALHAIEIFLERDAPVAPPPGDPDRWSGAWGPFQHRAVGLLATAGLLLDSPRATTLAARLRMRVEPEGPATVRRYVHEWCYALEGAALAGDVATVADAATGLLALQREDGGLPSWTRGECPARTDATAQAIRLWCASPRSDRDAIARGLGWLAGRQAPSGGLRYEEASDDLTTWATCFADQATAWAESESPPDGWI